MNISRFVGRMVSRTGRPRRRSEMTAEARSSDTQKRGEGELTTLSPISRSVTMSIVAACRRHASRRAWFRWRVNASMLPTVFIGLWKSKVLRNGKDMVYEPKDKEREWECVFNFAKDMNTHLTPE